MTALQKLRDSRPGKRLSQPAYWGNALWSLVRAVILFGIGFMILYPILIKFVTCFMSMNDLSDPTVKLIPLEGSTELLRQVYVKMDYWRTFATTAALSLLVAVAQVFVSALAGYGLARFKFRGRGLLFALILVVLLVPPSTILTPLYVRFNYMSFFGLRFSLINTYWPFILMSFTGLGLKNGLYIYMMRQFFRGMPYELEESAYIDGAGPLRAFRSVMLPNARNMLLVIFIFSFTWQWTDNAITPMFLNNLKVFANIVHSVVPDYSNATLSGAMNSISALLIMAPLLVIYLFLQRRIIQGVESSGIVG